MKIFSLTLLMLSFLDANIFTVTDSHGNVVNIKRLHHKTNAYLTQKETEYSLQAIYDELKRAEQTAKKAQHLHARAMKITQAKHKATQAGKIYTLTDSQRQILIEDAKYFKGGRYVWGGTTPEGFDCSGYVQYLYKKHHVSLPRTAWAQSQKGVSVDRKNLRKGDLLFFLTDKARGIPVTHVGIYLGNGQFIHAASKKKGIIVSPLFSGHYADTYVSARRVI